MQNAARKGKNRENAVKKGKKKLVKTAKKNAVKTRNKTEIVQLLNYSSNTYQVSPYKIKILYELTQENLRSNFK